MKIQHKILAIVLLFLVMAICFFLDASMTETVSQNLVTFFSVVFGFYMTSIAILYNAQFTKKLYNQIDDNAHQRGVHVLKSYLLASGYWSISSIIVVIIYTVFATTDNSGVLSFNFGIFNISDVLLIDVDALLSSITFGISSVNILFMLLLLHTIIDGMITEAKEA